MNKFKVGDKVRVIEQATGYFTFPIGTEGTVIEVCSPNSYKVQDSTKDYWYYGADQIERITE